MAPIWQFADGFNLGNTQTAMAAFAPAGVTIIDDVPPFHWSGRNAMTAWVKDLTAAETKAGIAGGNVTLGPPLREISDGKRAYVVVPGVYHFTDRGRPKHDVARMAFALQKIGDTWLIVGWSWGGAALQSGK